MTITLRVLLIAGSILTAAMILRKIRNAKLQIEDSIFWLGFSSVLILFSIFPRIPAFLASLAGTQTPANFIYLAVIFLLIVKLFHMSIKLSQLESRVKDLVQELALEENARRGGRMDAVWQNGGTSEPDGQAVWERQDAGQVKCEEREPVSVQQD